MITVRLRLLNAAQTHTHTIHPRVFYILIYNSYQGITGENQPAIELGQVGGGTRRGKHEGGLKEIWGSIVGKT